MPEIKLKPCPFCGQPINLIEGNALFGWHKPSCFWHYLDDGKISAMSQEELTAAAVKAWNHRADGWHKWPEEKPNLVDSDYAYGGNYIVTVLTGNKRETLEAGYERIMKRGKREERWVHHGRIVSWPVLAWRELPEPWEGE